VGGGSFDQALAREKTLNVLKRGGAKLKRRGRHAGNTRNEANRMPLELAFDSIKGKLRNQNQKRGAKLLAERDQSGIGLGYIYFGCKETEKAGGRTRTS